MDFKYASAFSVFVFLQACSSGVNEAYQGDVGVPLENASPIYQLNHQASDSFFYYDEPSERILGLNLADLTLQQELSSANGPQQTVLSHFQGNYVLSFSKKHLEVIKPDNSRSSNPFAFQGEPESAAFHAEEGLLVMKDSLSSLGIMQISASGDIADSWLGGSLLEAQKTLVAADIDDSGQLVASSSDESLLLVDLASTLEQEAWVFSSFEPALGQLTWVAPLPEDPSLVLVAGERVVAVVDTAAQLVVDSLTLDGTILFKSKLGQPHILAEVGGLARILFYDAGLQYQPLPVTDKQNPQSSLLKDGVLSLLFGNEFSSTKEVYGLRLSDNLVVTEASFLQTGAGYLGPDFLLVNTQAPLGLIKKFSFGSQEVQTAQGFNIDHFLRK